MQFNDDFRDTKLHQVNGGGEINPTDFWKP